MPAPALMQQSPYSDVFAIIYRWSVLSIIKGTWDYVESMEEFL